MLTSILTFLAGLTRFLPLIEKWGDVLYREWKFAQAEKAAKLAKAKETAVAARDAQLDADIQADAIAARARQQTAQALVYQQNEAARLALAREQADNPPAPAQFKPTTII